MSNSKEKQSRLTLLTVPEAAKELRVSKWMIYELIRTNQLKSLTIATRRLVASDDLTHFINERKDKEHET